MVTFIIEVRLLLAWVLPWQSFSIFWIFHECRGWLVCGYLIFCEVVLRPESVVSDICINHVFILSHYSRGMDGRDEGSYVVVVSTYVHADQNGSIFQAQFPFRLKPVIYGKISGIFIGLMWACLRVWYPDGIVFLTVSWYPYFLLDRHTLPTSGWRHLPLALQPNDLASPKFSLRLRGAFYWCLFIFLFLRIMKKQWMNVFYGICYVVTQMQFKCEIWGVKRRFRVSLLRATDIIQNLLVISLHSTLTHDIMTSKEVMDTN